MKVRAALAVFLVLAAVPVWADTLRAPQVSIPDTSSDPEPDSLWEIAPVYLDDTVWGNQTDPDYWRTQQHLSQIWAVDLPDPTWGAQLWFEIAGNRDGNVFGIYAPVSATSIAYLPIFSGGTNPIAQATVAVQLGNPNWTFSFGGSSITVPYGLFGFYLQFGNQYFYSQDWRNGGNAQMLAYSAAGATDAGDPAHPNPADFLLVWEDLPLPSSDHDYNDMGVTVKGVHPVPEPGSLLLLGIGLVGLGIAARKRVR